MMEKGSFHHFCIAVLAFSVPWIVQERRPAQKVVVPSSPPPPSSASASSSALSYSEKEWDVVTITDDYHFSFGEYEDKPLLDSLERMGRKAIRVSIQDETFDFNSTKAVVIRSAWGKYHCKCTQISWQISW